MLLYNNVIIIITKSFLMANLIYSGTVIYLVLLLTKNIEQILPIPSSLALVLHSDFLNDSSSLRSLLKGPSGRTSTLSY